MAHPAAGRALSAPRRRSGALPTLSLQISAAIR
jgi:hypothetical protein